MRKKLTVLAVGALLAGGAALAVAGQASADIMPRGHGTNTMPRVMQVMPHG